jgi:hypothetical protein
VDILGKTPGNSSQHRTATKEQTILCGTFNNVTRRLGTPISRLAPLHLTYVTAGAAGISGRTGQPLPLVLPSPLLWPLPLNHPQPRSTPPKL